MINYKLIEEELNLEAKKILLLIKEDYYKYMNEEKQKRIDILIESNIVVVNQGQSIFKDNTLAHGGRALKDGKIHFYPDVRKFESNDEAVNKCKKILLHECFHYFLQPDKVEHNVSELEDKMLHYYTEGLVEKESRIFHERHKDEIDFEEANYGFNINFVNLIQNRLNVGSKELIFGAENYLANILDFLQISINLKKEKMNYWKKLKKYHSSFQMICKVRYIIE